MERRSQPQEEMQRGAKRIQPAHYLLFPLRCIRSIHEAEQTQGWWQPVFGWNTHDRRRMKEGPMERAINRYKFSHCDQKTKSVHFLFAVLKDKVFISVLFNAMAYDGQHCNVLFCCFQY